MTSLDIQRCALLVAAPGFVLLDQRTPELRLVHSWLSSWTAIGLIAAGMARQDFDLQLTRYDERWRATFYSARDRALGHDDDRFGVGADAVVRGAAGGVGGAPPNAGRSDRRGARPALESPATSRHSV